MKAHGMENFKTLIHRKGILTVVPCILILSKFFYLPTDAREFCFKRNIEIYIKNAPTCFGLITIIRERTIWALLQLLLLKQSELSVKIHRCGQFGGEAAYIIRSRLVYVLFQTVSQTYRPTNQDLKIHAATPPNWPQRYVTDNSDCFSNSNFSKLKQHAPWWCLLNPNMSEHF